MNHAQLGEERTTSSPCQPKNVEDSLHWWNRSYPLSLRTSYTLHYIWFLVVCHFKFCIHFQLLYIISSTAGPWLDITLYCLSVVACRKSAHADCTSGMPRNFLGMAEFQVFWQIKQHCLSSLDSESLLCESLTRNHYPGALAGPTLGLPQVQVVLPY